MGGQWARRAAAAAALIASIVAAQATHAGKADHADKAPHAGEAIHAGKARHVGEAARAGGATHAGESAALPDPTRFGADYVRFARDMDQGMRRMMHDMHAAGYSGNPDADFLAMMIAHHQGAVDMARLQLVHGRDPLARALAEEIIAGQTTEIAAMRARLSRLQDGADAEPDGFPALGATRGMTVAPAKPAAAPMPAAAGAASGASPATAARQDRVHGPGGVAR